MSNPFDGVKEGEAGPPFYRLGELGSEGKLFKLTTDWFPGEGHPTQNPATDARSDHAIVEALALDLAEDEEVCLAVSSKRLAVALGSAGAGKGDTIRISGHGDGYDRTYKVEVVT